MTHNDLEDLHSYLHIQRMSNKNLQFVLNNIFKVIQYTLNKDSLHKKDCKL